MSDAVWEMTHSVDVDADADLAWAFWADVGNWDDPPASFELEGGFAVGSRGWTRIPGAPPIAWFIRDVTPCEAATIEIPADGAAMVFAWRFACVGEGRTRITQRVALRGERAETYLGFAKTFETNLPGGMKKLAAAIADAAVKRVTKRL